jgi:penicillin-binding protein 2
LKRTAKDIEESNRVIGRRTLVMGGLFVGTSAVLAARMRYLQVERADDFRLLAEENRINIRLLPPERGLVFDRNGVLLAGNEQNYRITLVREDTDDLDAVLEQLSRLVNLDLAALDRAREEILRRPPFVPVTVADRLSWEELSSVAVNAPALPGVNPEVGVSRVYPLGADFAHVVGYVGPVSDYYIEQTGDTDPVLQIPDFQVGRYNVEARMEGRTARPCRHQAGRSERRRPCDARTRPREGTRARMCRSRSTTGYRTTSGPAERRKRRRGGDGLRTGDLLACASSPSYDPNLFVRGISRDRLPGTAENPYRPLPNKAVQGIYPPGSTFKMVDCACSAGRRPARPRKRSIAPATLDVATAVFIAGNALAMAT